MRRRPALRPTQTRSPESAVGHRNRRRFLPVVRVRLGANHKGATKCPIRVRTRNRSSVRPAASSARTSNASVRTPARASARTTSARSSANNDGQAAERRRSADLLSYGNDRAPFRPSDAACPPLRLGGRRHAVVLPRTDGRGPRPVRPDRRRTEHPGRRRGRRTAHRRRHPAPAGEDRPGRPLLRQDHRLFGGSDHHVRLPSRRPGMRC